MNEPDLAGPPARAEPLGERRTSPLELLWDLVFVFAVTQVTALLTHHLTASGFGESMLVLALVWWAWSAFVWVANAFDPDAGALRAALLAGTVAILVCGLALPTAFGGGGVLFVVAYAVVRIIHLLLYGYASRLGAASWSAISGFALTVGIAIGLLLAGALVGEPARALLWLAAAAIDYAGPAWLTRQRLRGLQRVAVAHFAERYSLFVIICLGESIVALGVGTRGEPLSASLVAAVALGLITTIELWWTYFYRAAAAAEQRLREHPDPVLAGADAYSYLHLPIVAGIIVFAVGAGALAHGVDSTLRLGVRLTLCGGVALYLVALAGFRLRLHGDHSPGRLLTAAAVLALGLLGGGLPGWALAAGTAVLLGTLCAVETRAGEVV